MVTTRPDFADHVLRGRPATRNDQHTRSPPCLRRATGPHRGGGRLPSQGFGALYGAARVWENIHGTT